MEGGGAAALAVSTVAGAAHQRGHKDGPAHEAQFKLDEVRRQIEAACPPLRLDPAAILAEASTPTHAPPAPRSSRTETSGPRAHYEERVADLLSDGRLIKGETLRTVHHGQEHLAKIEADGSVSGAIIGTQSTLTAAARALVGGERNGWKFWCVKRDGHWVPVADLRNS